MLQLMGSQRVGHNRATELKLSYILTHLSLHFISMRCYHLRYEVIEAQRDELAQCGPSGKSLALTMRPHCLPFLLFSHPLCCACLSMVHLGYINLLLFVSTH